MKKTLVGFAWSNLIGEFSRVAATARRKIWEFKRRKAIKEYSHYVCLIRNYEKLGKRECIEWFTNAVSLAKESRLDEIQAYVGDLRAIARVAYRGYLKWIKQDGDTVENRRKARAFYEEHVRREKPQINANFLSFHVVAKKPEVTN